MLETQLTGPRFVFLEAGDKLPADLRLLKSHGLQIQESILTGESVAVEKQTKPVALDTPLGDRFCVGLVVLPSLVDKVWG